MPRTIPEIIAAKGKYKLSALTAYDYPTAFMLDEAGVDILLVGDSLGNVVYGDATTLSVTMDDMLRHCRAVSRAAKNALVVADMPFGSFQVSVEATVINAVRCLKEGGAQAVKIEGGRHMAPTVRRLVDAGIPVMGHIGLTPQSYHQLGGYRIQGKTEASAERLNADAAALAQEGAFSIVIECVPDDVAGQIRRRIDVPLIGIGAGPDCDGQILVINDLLNLTVGHVPKFVEPLADLRSIITEAASEFVRRTKET